MRIVLFEKLKISKWIIGFFVFILILLVYIHFTELSKFVLLLRQIKPLWFLLALLFQVGTYACLAAVWWIALSYLQENILFKNLLLLSLAQLFVNQTIPSSGLSGTTVVTQFLLKRDISTKAIALAIALNVFARQISYILVFILSIAILWLNHGLGKALIILTVIFTSIMVIIFAGAAVLWILARKNKLPSILKRHKNLESLVSAIKKLNPRLLLDVRVSLPAIALSIAIFIFDSLTLWMILLALGIHLNFALVFSAQVIAQAVATLSFVPGGLGVFEGSLTGVLHLLGLSIEPALAATILFRGLTYWLPMIPGFFITQKEARKKKKQE
ncbi:lysylphosphatidylglycerol synthase transmembrane domain-containing protein [Legionella jordanis]|uniref:Integral membrane protein n=1 Tax=Legionella jordanis TaxID=456 RepID=A0A0W0VCC5_9GAMM|nr:lysylphosphatidylglycerol synthase transmembrane domain-containing protein [Legionella jordanis]KTD17736.1 hypothetical protein Ljor_2042 [Legionella jordanis]RMX01599.1 TIGR00374 family protein [Legionella jordanis]RMX21595.1 TIGR00374 family protein [Legionella jordanis]VEH11330.1 Uncharacterised protein family (UPF0104) [Legionella jordanis]HAT8714508.1 flippase-like domain-containing protein [Legionella jordanis]